jgi:hypothetical protein
MPQVEQRFRIQWSKSAVADGRTDRDGPCADDALRSAQP